MSEVHDIIHGKIQKQTIRVYVNAKTEAFSTDLLFPSGIPVNGVVSLFVGDFSEFHTEENCPHPTAAELVMKQKLVTSSRRFQGLPTCIPLPCDPAESVGSIWKFVKSTDEYVTVSASHLTVPDDDDQPPPNDFVEQSGSPCSSKPPSPCRDDAPDSVSPDAQEESRICDTSAPAFDFFTTSEESDVDEPLPGDSVASSVRSESLGGIDAYVCGLCDRKFDAKEYCKRHVWQHLPSIETSFKCAECKKIFTSSYSLKRHYNAFHTGRELAVCKVCSKHFSSEGQLTKHMEQKHARNIRVYTCEHCCKMFVSKGNYNSHLLRYHSNEEDREVPPSVDKPDAPTLDCRHCLSFSTTSELMFTKHLKELHPTVEVFQCSLCSLLFQVGTISCSPSCSFIL